jgi:tripartite-type tricarboxylate transporter receptor subunit TctC
MMKRRRILAIGLATAGSGQSAWSQDKYPSRPVRLIVPFPPGQATDVAARILAERLGTMWGQAVIVDNRAGGGGVPAMVAAKSAAPDGYTAIMATSGTVSINTAVYKTLPYDSAKDFAAVSNAIRIPLVLVGSPQFDPQTIEQLVAAAKRDPGKINFASAGPGTSQHMMGELLKLKASIDIEHIPYKGSSPALADVMAGRVPLMFDSVLSALPYIKSGKVHALAVTTAGRVDQLPDIPTMAESGYPEVEGFGWAGLLFPVATPPPIVDGLSTLVRTALSDPPIKKRIEDLGCIPDPTRPVQFADFIAAETRKWAAVARAANVHLD